MVDDIDQEYRDTMQEVMLELKLKTETYRSGSEIMQIGGH